MFCHQCGAPNPDEGRFCTQCGAALTAAQPTPAPIAVADNMELPKGEVFTYSAGEFAYARVCSLANTGSYYCECIDGVSTCFIEPAFAKRSDRAIASIGDYIWVRLTEPQKVTPENCRYGTGRYYNEIFANMYETITYEYKQFKQYHGIGETILASIERVDQVLVVVRLAPRLTGVCPVDSLPSHIASSSITPNSIHAFTIVSFDDSKNRVVLSFQESSSSIIHKPSLSLWDQLPSSIHETIIPKHVLAFVEEQRVNAAITGESDAPLTNEALRNFLDKAYQEEYAAHRITVKQNAQAYRMDFYTGLRNDKGVPLSAAFKKVKNDPRGERWVMNLFGFTSVESVFERYIYVENFDQAANELAALALSGEEWDYGGGREKGKKFILKQYLRFNFYKSWLDGLLVTNAQGEAVFNTGLVDGSYDSIYCYLKCNTHTDDFFHRQWELDSFACWGKGQVGKALNIAFSSRPAVPQYIDPNKIQDIYYNITKPLFCDYEHIVADNLSRLPLEFIAAELARYSEVIQAVDTYKASGSYRDFEQLKNLVVNNEMYMRRITEGLRQAVETAKKYCEWNYKTAIPIYYPRNNTVSLLLPLCLTNDQNRADVALVVERLPNGNYQGQTILTLQMAYLDARQICRPNSEWLTVDQIDQNSEELEESE